MQSLWVNSCLALTTNKTTKIVGLNLQKSFMSKVPLTKIVTPSVSRSDITMNDFIKAKEKLLKRDFEGIKYIYCPE